MQPDERVILIRVDQKLSDLSDSVKQYESYNTKAHESIEKKIENYTSDLHNRIDNQEQIIYKSESTFLRNRTFYWVTGFIIVVIISICGFASTNRLLSERNATSIEYIKNLTTNINK